jgi:hypothetical protein
MTYGVFFKISKSHCNYVGEVVKSRLKCHNVISKGCGSKKIAETGQDQHELLVNEAMDIKSTVLKRSYFPESSPLLENSDLEITHITDSYPS